MIEAFEQCVLAIHNMNVMILSLLALVLQFWCLLIGAWRR